MYYRVVQAFDKQTKKPTVSLIPATFPALGTIPKGLSQVPFDTSDIAKPETATPEAPKLSIKGSSRLQHKPAGKYQLTVNVRGGVLKGVSDDDSDVRNKDTHQVVAKPHLTLQGTGSAIVVDIEKDLHPGAYELNVAFTYGKDIPQKRAIPIEIK